MKSMSIEIVGCKIVDSYCKLLLCITLESSGPLKFTFNESIHGIHSWCVWYLRNHKSFSNVIEITLQKFFWKHIPT